MLTPLPLLGRSQETMACDTASSGDGGIMEDAKEELSEVASPALCTPLGELPASAKTELFPGPGPVAHLGTRTPPNGGAACNAGATASPSSGPVTSHLQMAQRELAFLLDEIRRKEELLDIRRVQLAALDAEFPKASAPPTNRRDSYGRALPPPLRVPQRLVPLPGESPLASAASAGSTPAPCVTPAATETSTSPSLGLGQSSSTVHEPKHAVSVATSPVGEADFSTAPQSTAASPTGSGLTLARSPHSSQAVAHREACLEAAPVGEASAPKPPSVEESPTGEYADAASHLPG